MQCGKKIHFQIEYMCVYKLIVIFMFKCVRVCVCVVVVFFLNNNKS